ncbi:MAG: transketolase family protein [Clostridiales bacterium]|nr:transketolase family protein [Clostridiales bacterium]
MSKISTRAAYGEALAEIGSDPNIVVLDADLQCCTRTDKFAALYPQRARNVGIAEANMVGMAAGLATCGKTVFVNSFAMFTAGRAFEQIRNSLAYPHLNVKVIGTHAGVTVGKDGATHQCLEDLAAMRAIPGMVVLSPCDANEAKEATKAIAAYDGPCFMRLGRLEVDTCTDAIPGYHFELGKAAKLADGDDATIIATGLMVQEALKARQLLLEQGVHAAVLDIHTIKPLDQEAVIAVARQTGCIVTAEEANVLGGLGAAVAETVCENCPVPVLRVGVQDQFGRSGDPLELMEYYHLTAADIAEKTKQAISMKK